MAALVCVAPLQDSVFFMLVVGLLVVILQANPVQVVVEKAVLVVAQQPLVKPIQAVVVEQIIIILSLNPAALVLSSFVILQRKAPLLPLQATRR
jgi:hypothetical protein